METENDKFPKFKGGFDSWEVPQIPRRERIEDGEQQLFDLKGSNFTITHQTLLESNHTFHARVALVVSYFQSIPQPLSLSLSPIICGNQWPKLIRIERIHLLAFTMQL